MSAGEPFESARLVMRAYREDDAEALHAIYIDETAMRYWSHGPHTTIEQTREKLRRNLVERDWRGWVIALKDGDVPIGNLAAGIKRQGKVVEIGYALVPSCWGGGYAREAVRALIERLFAEGNRRVFADTDPDNMPSRRLLESLGFTLEGHLRGEWETHLGVRDSVIYGILADEWNSARRPT